MPLPTPSLDNRRYADIVAEATSRIPRYTPEWTDHNASDRGITLVQLFARITEMLLFQMNRVPELTYIKFLELLGITLRPAVPARAELTFTVVDPPPGLIVSVPKGTRVAAAGVEGQPPVVFETDEGLQALGAKPAAVLAFDGFDYIPVTSANAGPAGQGYEPFGPHARRDSALYLGFDFAGVFSRVQMNLLVYVAEDGSRTATLRCREDKLDVPSSLQLVWEGWDGTTWSRLPLDKDETRTLTRSGHIYLRVPRDDSLIRRTMPEVTGSFY